MNAWYDQAIELIGVENQVVIIELLKLSTAVFFHKILFLIAATYVLP